MTRLADWRRAVGAAAIAVLALTSPAAALVPPDEPVVDTLPESWPQLDLDVAAHLLVDAETGQMLAASNADVRRPVASTVKILTALSVVQRTDLDEDVTVGPEVVVPGSGVGLEPGVTWNVNELLEGMLARSGNDAAEALAAHVAGGPEELVEAMSRDAERLGVSDVSLASVTGLDDANLLSATDLAVLARTALDDDVLRPILGAPHVELPSVGRVENRNEMLFTYPGATGVKTGFTGAAGYSLVASAERDGRELVAVVLGADADPDRFEAAAALLDMGYDEFAAMRLGGRLRLSVGGGEVVHEVEPFMVTTPVDDPAALAWPVPRRPQQSVTVSVRTATDELAAVEAVRVEGSGSIAQDGEAGAGQLGRAIADGVYVALRAAVADDASGSLVGSSEGASP